MNDIRSLLTQESPSDKIDTNDSSPIIFPDCESDVVKAVTLAQENMFRICPLGTMTHIDSRDIGDWSVNRK